MVLLTQMIMVLQMHLDYFSTIGNKLSHHIFSSVNPSKFLDNNPVPNSIFLSPVSVAEICDHINSLKPGKAPGIDGIPAKLLRSASYILAPALCHIFNNVFLSGVYPDSMKVAKVIPLFKKGDCTLPENYRPISLLPCLNKLFEGVIEKRLRKFFNDNNSLYGFQFGFREGHSTTHALLETVNSIRSQLDVGNNVLGLYLDLKKAFDTVDHSILLQKLYHYGIRGSAHQILSSYLCNRKQCIYVNGTYSNYLSVNIGVPQGSVLGPLLFLIYINDVHNAIPNVSTRLFADDTNVFLFDRSCDDLIVRGVDTLHRLCSWFDTNKLTLHLGKTNFTIFHSREVAHPCYDHFVFKDVKIKKSSSTRYLGLIIDEKLNWVDHISDLCNSVIKYTGIFYHLRGTFPKTTAIQVYYSFIYSKLRYAIEIYGTANKSYLKPLHILHNRLIKVLTGKPRRYPTNQLYREFNLLMLSDIHTYCMCSFVYNFRNKLLPEVISDAVCYHRITNDRITRNNNFFNVTRHSSHHGKLLLNNCCFSLWQSLPSSITTAKSLGSFQMKFKIYLSNTYN